MQLAQDAMVVLLSLRGLDTWRTHIRKVSLISRDIHSDPESHGCGSASVAPAPLRLYGLPFHIPRSQALTLDQIVGELGSAQ
jgi:hypothetical protein